MLLQSGGNAIPLGKRKAATAAFSNDSSGSDSDEPLPGELDSDAAEDFDEAGSDSSSDTSQLQMPDDEMDNGALAALEHSESSDSEEDTPLAAERQSALSRQKLVPSVSQLAAKAQQRSLLDSAALSNDILSTHDTEDSVDDGDDDNDDETAQHVSASTAARRHSHQVGL